MNSGEVLRDPWPSLGADQGNSAVSAQLSSHMLHLPLYNSIQAAGLGSSPIGSTTQDSPNPTNGLSFR